jgi:hypothetical protein
MELPPDLSAFLSTNTLDFDKPTPAQREYLGQGSNPNDEVDELGPELKMDKGRNNHKTRLEEKSRLESPVHAVPPEIWGLIFAFTLGDKPFGLEQYRTYGHLRRICTAWTDVLAGTPDLCRGLVVYLDLPIAENTYSHAEGMQLADEKLKPWLAIVSRNYPYHLVISAKDYVSLQGYSIARACQWIFATSPTPTILSISNSDIFLTVCEYAPQDLPISHLALDFHDDVEDEGLINS